MVSDWTGMDFGKTEEEARGLAGAIKGVTEETAGLLAGQFQNVIINTKIISQGVSIMTAGVSTIADNTTIMRMYTAVLPAMAKKIADMETYLRPSAGQNAYLRSVA